MAQCHILIQALNNPPKAHPNLPISVRPRTFPKTLSNPPNLNPIPEISRGSKGTPIPSNESWFPARLRLITPRGPSVPSHTTIPCCCAPYQAGRATPSSKQPRGVCETNYNYHTIPIPIPYHTRSILRIPVLRP